jgi:predicted methyltransferase
MTRGLRPSSLASSGAPEQKARDRYRHPYEALTFFGIEEDVTVVEIYPAPAARREITPVNP